jgi:hypothetical protein
LFETHRGTLFSSATRREEKAQACLRVSRLRSEAVWRRRRFRMSSAWSDPKRREARVRRRRGVAAWQIQDLADSVAGAPGPCRVIAGEADLQATLDWLSGLEPRVVELVMRPGEYLNLGIGGPVAFVEHVTNEPYRAETAVPRQPYTDPYGLGYVSFRCGRIGSEIDNEWIMPVAEAVEIVLSIYRNGELPAWGEWQPS